MAMDDPQCGVTVGDGVDDHAYGHDVVNAGDVAVVLEELAVQGVEVLGVALTGATGLLVTEFEGAATAA
jgi:UDP-N-acetylmuramyl tripeptide synthase